MNSEKPTELNDNHKSGVVCIAGKPNAGKSTLMNALIGEKLSIITPKAQTTRHHITGILNGPDYQILLTDTPGIIKPRYGLHKSMMKAVQYGLEGADAVLWMLDAGESMPVEDEAEQIQRLKIPVFILLNKVDLLSQNTIGERLKQLKEAFPEAKAIYAISALNRFNLKELMNEVLPLMPVSPPFYDKNQLSDKPEKFFASEIIREKIFLRYQKEIPYSCEIVIASFKDEPNILHIAAEIIVERPAQKGILIGKGGIALKNTGTAARKALENFFGKKVFLETFVKVKENWRDSGSNLREFGYEV